MKNTIILAVCFMSILGCQKNKGLTIVPMNEYINEEIKYGVQFFEIDNYSKYPMNNLMDSILAFSEQELSKNNQMPPKVGTQYFYNETLFGACSNELINMDSDSYIEGLQDCMDRRVARIWIYPSSIKVNDSLYIKNDSIYIRGITVRNDSFIKDSIFPSGKRRIYISRIDSILIKGKEWKILKKGEIEKN